MTRIRLAMGHAPDQHEEHVMRIGSSIALIAIGAILAFALAPGIIPFLDQVLVGYILMVVGVIGLIVSIAMSNRTRRTVVERRGDPHTVVERRPEI
jgi:hypothetical protein